ncbi:MAG TPA: L,D-transpeptidase family protein [Blastocatellia bacterium]|nr:L,D-transpeptidase family protein [Blastocatellia bacterium]
MINRKRIFSFQSAALRLAAWVAMIVFATGSLAVEASAQKSKRSKKIAATKSSQAKASRVSADVREAEQLLHDLGYWAGPIDGRMDELSRHALIAFQKVEGRERTGRFSRDELEALRAAGRPQPRDKSYAHIEIDLDRQVLFVVGEGGEVAKVLPVSTGNGEEFTNEGWTRRAITPTGRFKVHNKIKGWRKSPLGMIYYPVYFLSGIAIHGYSSVPVTAASHGCVRIPIAAAKEFYEEIPEGMFVIVHGQPAARHEARAPKR